MTKPAIVCLSSIEWSFSWQVNQEIMSRLARAGHPVLYVETTGVRSFRPLKPSDWARVRARLRRNVAPSPGPSVPNLTILAPIAIPYPHSRLAHAINAPLLARQVRRWLARQSAGGAVLWSFLPSPMTLGLMERVRWDATIYQYMGSAPDALPIPGIGRAEQQILERVDLVFANSVELHARASRVNDASYLARAGVSLEKFVAERMTPGPVPADIARIPRPIVGYIGTVHDWVDLALIERTARDLPEVRIVVVGAVRRDLGKLADLPNVHLLGQKSHDELPRYVAQFDVGLIPYVLDAYTASSFPGKLCEYLAMGVPVVSTPLPEVEQFEREFPGSVGLADASRFARAVREALVAKHDHAALVRVAEANGWAERLAGLWQRVEEQGKRAHERIRSRMPEART